MLEYVWVLEYCAFWVSGFKGIILIPNVTIVIVRFEFIEFSVTLTRVCSPASRELDA